MSQRDIWPVEHIVNMEFRPIGTFGNLLPDVLEIWKVYMRRYHQGTPVGTRRGVFQE